MARQSGRKEPIRSKNQIKEIKDWLLMNNGYRDYFMFYLGINTGLRIGDLVKLKVSDVRNTDEIRTIQGKTKKEVTIPISKYVQNEIDKYCKDKADSDYLFPSRKKKDSHITTAAADFSLGKMAKALELKSWGTHSMRKTFGYHYYQKTNDVYYLMRLFGHTTQTQTLRYICIELDEIKETLKDFAL